MSWRCSERGDHGAIPELLCREACFVTQDATAIYGRDRVASLLAQFTVNGLGIRSELASTLRLGDLALVSACWWLTLPARPVPLKQATRPILALARRDDRWKLLLIAPWGWPGDLP